MKTIKPVLFAAFALAGMLSLQPMARAAETSAAAQPAQDERGAAIRERMQAVAKELGLTDEQKQQLKPILQAEAEKMKALRDDQSLSRPEKLEKLKAIREELLPQLKEILTPEQLTKWQKLRQERQAKAAPVTARETSGKTPAATVQFKPR
jgi:Spy/CpxP family protein refolding chaperone